MTLTTHAVVGGAMMKLMPQYPVAGLFFAFASHFVLDAIPHWEYKLNSYDYNEKEPLKSVIHLNKKFLGDLIKIGSDGILGMIISLILFSSFWGVVFAVLPDFLQFLYLRIRREPFTSFQKFHSLMHTKYDTNKLTFTSVFSQVAAIALTIIIFLVK